MDELPEGWEWDENKVITTKEEYVHSANLYAPHGCHAGEIRRGGYGGNVIYYTHTWDEEGVGGENASHESYGQAKAFVEAAILRQGFHMECEFNCSDNGDVEEAAEIASLAWDSLSGDARDVVHDIVEAMLGPKRFREWCEEAE